MKTKFHLPLVAIFLAAVGCRGLQSVKSGQDTPLTSCPNVITAEGNFTRIVVVRLKNGTDLLGGLKESVKKENIRNAVILTGIGSLTQYHIHVVNNTTFPPGNTFVKKDNPVDILNVNGYVFDGRVHAHITVSTDEKAVGGHLEPDSKVFTFAIITLGVLNDRPNLDRFDDYNRR